MDGVKITTKHKSQLPLLLLFFVAAFGIGYMLLNFPPGSSLTIGQVVIPYLWIFFVLLFLCIYGLVAFFLKSAVQGILFASLVVCFLLFRLFNITHPFFLGLLLVLFLCLEGVLWRRK